MDEEITKIYGNRLRVRVSGLCFQGGKLLMVNHDLYDHDFWAPPGGGLSFGEKSTTALRREFVEETGLAVETGNLLFVCELLQPPLHAVELFFSTTALDGKIGTGTDPETAHRVIREVQWMSEEEVYRLPDHQRHGIFRHAPDFSALAALRGYYKI